MPRVFWDFYGGGAAGTAAHHRRHLDEFLAREGFHGCRTGVERYTPLHHVAWCHVPPTYAETIIQTLRPRRVVSDAEWAAFEANRDTIDG